MEESSFCQQSAGTLGAAFLSLITSQQTRFHCSTLARWSRGTVIQHIRGGGGLLFFSLHANVGLHLSSNTQTRALSLLPWNRAHAGTVLQPDQPGGSVPDAARRGPSTYRLICRTLTEISPAFFICIGVRLISLFMPMKWVYCLTKYSFYAVGLLYVLNVINNFQSPKI